MIIGDLKSLCKLFQGLSKKTKSCVGTYRHCWYSPHRNQGKLPEEYIATWKGKKVKIQNERKIELYGKTVGMHYIPVKSKICALTANRRTGKIRTGKKVKIQNERKIKLYECIIFPVKTKICAHLCTNSQQVDWKE